MIELTEEQVQPIEQEEPPPVLVHSQTREEFVLVRKQVYERMQQWVAPFKRGWDNPADDDLIRKS